MTQSDVATYTTRDINTLFSSTTPDPSKSETLGVWKDDIPSKDEPFVFWSPEMIGDDTFGPDDKIWTEIDEMLKVVWASGDIMSLEEEARIHSEMLEAIHMSEIRQFEELYGEPDSWE